MITRPSKRPAANDQDQNVRGATRVATRPSTGTDTVLVTTNLHDSNGSHTLSGRLDDYTVSFTRFE